MNQVKQLIGTGTSVKDALKSVDMAKSSYYYKPSPRKERPLDPELVNDLNGLKGYELTYGNPRVTHLFKRRGKEYNHKKVYRHRKRLGKLQPRKRRGLKPTQLEYSCSMLPNMRWETDFTTVACGSDGNGYGVALIDCRIWKVVGDHFSQRCRADEAIIALKMAITQQFGGEVPKDWALIIRADRGSQFIARKFRKEAAALGLTVVFCGIQSPNDKPYIENFIGMYKGEEVYRNEYLNFTEARAGWKKYITWYNTERLHSSLGYKPPVEVETEFAGERNPTVADASAPLKTDDQNPYPQDDLVSNALSRASFPDDADQNLLNRPNEGGDEKELVDLNIRYEYSKLKVPVVSPV